MVKLSHVDRKEILVFEIEQHDRTGANTILFQGEWYIKDGGL